MENGFDLLQLVIEDFTNVSKRIDTPVVQMTFGDYVRGGGKYSQSIISRVGGLKTIKSVLFSNKDPSDLAVFQELRRINRENLKLERTLGTTELFFTKLKNSIGELPIVKIKPYKTKKKHKKISRTLNLVLSDLHFGSDLNIKEHGHNYGKVEEARALAAVIKNVLEYKLQYRDETELVINILGDIIQNELHGRTSADLLHSQTCRAIWLLTHAIGLCAQSFRKVTVNMVTGNHGRDMFIHQNRANSLKFNSIETTIYYAIKNAFRNVLNVTFNQPLSAWITYEAQGHKMYATHGDTHLNPGNPGKSVNIDRVQNNINKINASLKDTDEYKVFICGHVHLPLVTNLPNGAYLVINGALTPPDSYAQSLNILESKQVQVLFETTSEYPVGDFRFIDASQSYNNPELDKIIPPFKDIDF